LCGEIVSAGETYINDPRRRRRPIHRRRHPIRCRHRIRRRWRLLRWRPHLWCRWSRQRHPQEITPARADFLVERRGFEPMAIAVSRPRIAGFRQ
jgi:hypothetical protein